MILRIAALTAVLSLFRCAAAEVAPEITTVAEGYNVIAKIPCVGCAFLYQDTSKGKDEPWTQRKDENALLLNISLPYDAAHLSINNAALLTSSKILPKVHAAQVLLDTSKADLSSLIAANQLDTPGGAFFGVSYAYSLRHIKSKSSRALLFRFDIMELWTDLLTTPLTVILDDPKQKVLEIVLLERALLSAGDPGNAFEIIRAELVTRPENEPRAGRRTMWFQDWDAHGKKGTTAHLVNSASESVFEYVTSGVWTLVLFIVGIICLFFVFCLLLIFGCGWHKDEYERAQQGKRRSGRESGSWGGNDVEKARRFRTAEELGLRSSGRVVGVGKSD